MTPETLAKLRRSVQGEVLSSDGARKAYATDFGGLQAAIPEAVVPVTTEEELSAVLRLLRQEEVPVTIRGGGFSCHGRTLTHGVVLQNGPAEIAIQQEAEGLVTVSGRTPWASVVAQLKELILIPRVLTHSLSPTVGGTLSAGGFGAASISAGAQVDHVHKLRLVLPDGSAKECSPTENQGLFRCALAGLGRIGVIEQATIAVEPYHPFFRVETQHFENLAAAEHLLQHTEADLCFLESRQGEVRSRAGYRAGIQHLFGEEEIVSPENFCAGSPAFHMAASRHIWCDYLLNPSALGPFLRRLDTELSRTGLDRIQVLPIRRPSSTPGQSLQPLRAFESDRYFGVGIFYSFDHADENGIAGARETQHMLLRECLRLDGRPYLCGAHHVDDRDLEEIFGDEFRRLLHQSRELDPKGLFNSPRAAPLR